MDYEHLSYVEALRYLAKKYNIEVVEKEETAEDIANRQRNESLLLVSEYAGDFFKEQLRSGEGRAVGLEYFHSRGSGGFDDREIRAWLGSVQPSCADGRREGRRLQGRVSP